MFARAFSRFASLAAPAPQRGWNAFVLPSRHFATAAGGANPFKNQLLLTLSSPSEAIYVRTPVRSVTVPGSEGAMTMTNGHSQTVARLKAGEIIVRKGETGDEVERFFLSDGFVLFKRQSRGRQRMLHSRGSGCRGRPRQHARQRERGNGSPRAPSAGCWCDRRMDQGANAPRARTAVLRHSCSSVTTDQNAGARPNSSPSRRKCLHCLNSVRASVLELTCNSFE
uniref:ATP synthase, putative n=1 Tax=Toxoplasma gondii (strain ATCC 50861 / VEG) TaxID=432359 RepID=A0A0F7V8S3_TOXGV|nr:TPA: ATP synthase, putative [Toxoplasma gondii VEG]